MGVAGAALGLWHWAPGSGGVLEGGREGALAATHTFGVEGEQFLLDSRPFQIICGEMHYSRVPRAYWRDRMRKMRAMGLNTLCTYVFWNLHEPERGRFEFSGDLEVTAYVRAAQEEGLWVILRPGPYVCSEWDFGGLPAWLLRDGVKVRTTDPRFLEAAGRYLGRVGEELAPLEIARGGPIIMVQVENEYGSFGGTTNTWARSGRACGRPASKGRSTPPMERTGGTWKGERFRICRPSSISGKAGPPGSSPSLPTSGRGCRCMCGEYWDGWFDHWGEKHHVTSPEEAAAGLEWMLSRGISANLYMFHGGSSRGFMSGANFGGGYEPDVSSYDYDSPLDEAGRPTRKFFLMREVIRKRLPGGASSTRSAGAAARAGGSSFRAGRGGAARRPAGAAGGIGRAAYHGIVGAELWVCALPASGGGPT